MVPEIRKLRRRQYWADSGREQCAEDAGVEALAVSGGEYALDRQRVIGAPPQHSGAIQFEQLIDEHLARGEQQ